MSNWDEVASLVRSVPKLPVWTKENGGGGFLAKNAAMIVSVGYNPDYSQGISMLRKSVFFARVLLIVNIPCSGLDKFTKI